MARQRALNKPVSDMEDGMSSVLLDIGRSEGEMNALRDGGSWVAINQRLGGSAAGVKLAEQAKVQPRRRDKEEVGALHSAAFSIAMNGSEARLYVSWKHDDLQLCGEREKFLTSEPNALFRKVVIDIID
ncbi:hypothetical protein AAL_02105 [Moelleriella libera RCEF 2490]|uniref:Uncharacterized protein n=1 Tax=Moelleriella libera RCEF 2490 TaxID=1081109 RepID=A0A168F6G9_9HYPO|nr:hypothetical protein AAL_02105 [Moelleriella libera RCEF 2490]